LTRPKHGGNLVWAAQLAGCPPSEILDFSASINPLGPPRSAIAAIESHLHHLRNYPDPDYSQLRSVLGKRHDLPPDWILPGNGAAELLTWAGRDLGSLDRTYLVTPAFSDYWRSLHAFDAAIDSVSIAPELERSTSGERETRQTSIAPSGLPQLPARQRATERRGLLLNNPHNPSGKLWSREAILAQLPSFDLTIVDEAFMDFLPQEQQYSLISQVRFHENLVVIRSLTKFYSIPGLRLGYAVAHPSRLQRWNTWRDPWSVNVLAAAVGTAVLDDRDFQQQTWNWLDRARTQLYDGLAQLPGFFPLESAANFMLVRTEVPASQLQSELLQRHRILIRDCLSFPELGDRYFRVAVRSVEENRRLLIGLGMGNG
jgi:L-threonine-O-3-phosphate decarboxylase